ncbi:DNA primase [Candidatus Shapirobacteria bacterium CG_4_8_14_3_um_filter_35_11]|uniref:DNA primase n=2 Tax=Candidatus Shapironibacteriota TaxID=1752721 RepID=A0A2M8GJ28_9BACT|nr:MAG: DNA primase [Candidatus Shapirobacteria bacterium CG_4_8_14_3_um_filter_35_11]
MESQVEEIKKKLDIVDVINRMLPLKKRGRHYVANCPFHQEKTPSFTVSPEMQIFKCFGCGKGGDVFTFYEEFNHVDFREALEELAKIAGIKLKNSFDEGQNKNKKRILEINNEVAKFYHYMLVKHPLGAVAKKYVMDRGISDETIKLFGIGYSPEQVSLIANYLKKKGFFDSELIMTGTFGNSSYSNRLYDRFMGRLVFPLVDFRGQILGFSGRVLPGANPAVVGQKAKYINSPETEIYHKSQMVFGLNLAKEAIRQDSTVIVVEGEFDMISPYQAGIKNVVAVKGTAFTEEQLQLLRRYAETLVLALDADFAGNHAAIRSIELAEKLDFDIKVVDLLGKFKDPDEAVRDNPEWFKKRVEEAISIWDFIINSAVNTFGLENNKGKKEILNMALPFISRIKSEVIRSDYLHRLATIIGSDVESVKKEMERKISNFQFPISNREMIKTILVEKEPERDKRDEAEERLMTLIMGAKNKLKVAKRVDADLKFATIKWQKIMDLILANRIDWEMPLENVTEELKDIFGSTFLMAESESMESFHRKKEIDKIVAKLKSIDLKKQIADSAQRVAKFEREDNVEELNKAESENIAALLQLSKWQKLQK